MEYLWWFGWRVDVWLPVATVGACVHEVFRMMTLIGPIEEPVPGWLCACTRVAPYACTRVAMCLTRVASKDWLTLLGRGVSVVLACGLVCKRMA